MTKEGAAGLEDMTRTGCTVAAMAVGMTTTAECTRVVVVAVRTDIRRRCIRGNPNRLAICKPNRA